MDVKTFEVRDRLTLIPILAVRLKPGNAADRFLLARAGFGTSPETQAGYILVCKLAGSDRAMQIGPFDWPDRRTMANAHLYLEKHFDELDSGAVIDVEFLRGETRAPKPSEACAA